MINILMQILTTLLTDYRKISRSRTALFGILPVYFLTELISKPFYILHSFSPIKKAYDNFS